MVVGAGGCQRAEGLYVHRIRRTTVQNVGVRRQTTGAIGALLPHRHRRHEAVAKGAAIPAAAAARANGATHETRVSAGSPAGRPAGSAPRLCNAGGRRGPPGLLFPPSPLTAASEPTPLVFDNRNPRHNGYAITVSVPALVIPSSNDLPTH